MFNQFILKDSYCQWVFLCMYMKFWKIVIVDEYFCVCIWILKEEEKILNNGGTARGYYIK